ncbi:hypothetical protein CcI49_35655 [Frankia sp. CcI49]|nr:hypothetical protein CcI49_35655 [Frankia sp. CcI49]
MGRSGMTTDEQIAQHLRDMAKSVSVRSSADLWAGARSREPRERLRRTARWVAPAVALAVAATGIATGVLLSGGEGRASLTPADLPPGPATIQLHPLTFTPAETTRLVSSCRRGYSSVEGMPEPAFDKLKVWAAVRDDDGASVVLWDGPVFLDCDLPVDAAGQLAYDRAVMSDLDSGEPSPLSGNADLSLVGGGGNAIDDGSEAASEPGGGDVVSIYVAQASDQVARVTATVAAGVVEVPVQDGRVVVRTVQKGPWPGAGMSEQEFVDYMYAHRDDFEKWALSGIPAIRAYGRDGKQLTLIDIPGFMKAEATAWASANPDSQQEMQEYLESHPEGEEVFPPMPTLPGPTEAAGEVGGAGSPGPG